MMMILIIIIVIIIRSSSSIVIIIIRNKNKCVTVKVCFGLYKKHICILVPLKPKHKMSFSHVKSKSEPSFVKVFRYFTSELLRRVETLQSAHTIAHLPDTSLTRISSLWHVYIKDKIFIRSDH